MPGGAMHDRDRGELPAQRRRPPREIREEEGDGVRRRRQRVDALRGTPGGKRAPVGGIGAQRRGSAGCLGVGPRPLLELLPGRRDGAGRRDRDRHARSKS